MGTGPARDAVFTAYAQSLIRFKAKQLTRKPGFSRSEEEDLAQELTMRLLARADQFDPARASAHTCADRVIRSAIAMLLRDRRRLKRAAGFTAQSLERTCITREHDIAALRDSLDPSDLSRRTGTGNDEARRGETIAAVVEAFRSLPPNLQDICRRLIDGSAASVARNLGISRRQVGTAIEHIRSHFRAAGLGDS